jgi:hypothetical protein
VAVLSDSSWGNSIWSCAKIATPPNSSAANESVTTGGFKMHSLRFSPDCLIVWQPVSLLLADVGNRYASTFCKPDRFGLCGRFVPGWLRAALENCRTMR